MRIRDELSADLARIRAVHEAAFPTPGEADLVDRLRADGDLFLSLVATAGATIIGHAVFSRMAAPFRALGLGPIAILPEHQRSGVGSALIRAGIGRARHSGWQGIFVLGDPGYYERFGFEAERASGFECRYAGPHFTLLALGDCELSASGKVRYPGGFDALG